MVQPKKIRPFITEKLLMGLKESNQTNEPTMLRNRRLVTFRKRSKRFATQHSSGNQLYFRIKNSAFVNSGKYRLVLFKILCLVWTISVDNKTE